MYKLKNSYIDQMIKNRTTSKEIDFLLYISMFQDEHGKVNSVYYRHFMMSLIHSREKDLSDTIKLIQLILLLP